MKEDEPPWSPDAIDLINKRYLPGKTLSIQEWLSKVCSHICKHYPPQEKEQWLNKYYRMLSSRRFLPTSAALHNSLKGKGSLAGCIVLPLHKKSPDVIQKSMPEIAEVLFSGIGVGIDLSVLPPRHSVDEETGRANPGPCELLVAITTALESPVAYGGFKRSAFMAALHVQHPDTFEFIALKNLKKLPNVNISISFDDPFSHALSKGELLPILWEEVPFTKKHLIQMKKQANARHLPDPDLYLKGNGELFSRAMDGAVGRSEGENLFFDPQKILAFAAECAHRTGDPGLINLSAINCDNPTHPRYTSLEHKGRGAIHVTTPCGEQPLLPYEVCHLGSINLAIFAENSAFDFSSYQETVRTAVRFMDDLIDAGDNGLAEANSMSRANRKIGLGIMGLADALAELELPYDSDDALCFVDEIGRILFETAREESRLLAKERGPFPAWRVSKYAANLEPERRHATLTTIAPTGHIATLAGCSTAIEPYFLISYGRNAAGIRQESSRVLSKKLKSLGYSLQEWIKDTQKENPLYKFDGTLAGLSCAPTPCEERNLCLGKLKKVFKTAHEISPSAHLAVVTKLQKYIENGISKTINLPHEAKVEDVRSIFLESIKNNLKGMTVFRDRCLQAQALFQIASCPSCGKLDSLAPGDCAGLKCDPARGGCGFDSCLV